MTQFATITVTPQQAKNLTDEHNRLVKPSAHISPNQAHLLFGDNADFDMGETGQIIHEIQAHHTLTGNPVEMYINENEVTLTWQDEEA